VALKILNNKKIDNYEIIKKIIKTTRASRFTNHIKKCILKGIIIYMPIESTFG